MLALGALLAGCGRIGPEPSTTPTTAAQTAASTTATTTGPPDTPVLAEAGDGTGPAPDLETGVDAEFVCQRGDRRSDGRVERVELTEASGLAASRAHNGVLWAHNDSGQAAGLFAIDLAGRDLGFFALTAGGQPVDALDVEDVAIDGSTIYLADVGDNGRRRGSVTIYVFDEPEPGADGAVEVVRSIEVTYPDGPTDAEAVVVDPIDRVLVILSKDLDDVTAPTRIYSVPLPIDQTGDVSVEAELVGSLDVASISAGSSSISIGGLLFPGAVTGADLSPAADLVVLRTYGSAWLFTRSAGQSVVEALGGEPCEGGAAGETQGEAIAFLPEGDNHGGTVRYATLGEGLQQPVNLTTIGAAG